MQNARLTWEYRHKMLSATETAWDAYCGYAAYVEADAWEIADRDWADVNCPKCWVAGMIYKNEYEKVFG